MGLGEIKQIPHVKTPVYGGQFPVNARILTGNILHFTGNDRDRRFVSVGRN